MTQPAGEPWAYIALGSNLGDPILHVRQAMDRLAALSDRPLVRSSLWQTSPVDCPPDSPAFVNAVVALLPRPDETPGTLLAKLQEMERTAGRKPKQLPNEPRPLDLDLIAFGQEKRDRPELTLPHPRAHRRRFVLEPLNEIAPGLVLPGQREDVTSLLKRLASDEELIRVE